MAVVPLFFTHALSAQSLVSGEIAGTVLGDGISPLGGVRIELAHPGGGTAREIETGRSGDFRMPFVPGGEYEILAEQLGYLPVRLLNVPVRPGAVTQVTIDLSSISGAPTRIDTIGFAGAGTSGAQPGIAQWMDAVLAFGLPGAARGLGDIARLASNSLDGAFEGLSPGFSGILSQGRPYDPLAHPTVGNTRFRTDLFPPLASSASQILLNETDVEISEAAGGVLARYASPPSNTFRGQGFVDWSGDALASSKYFEPSDATASSIRGGVQFTGSVVKDTALFSAGVEMRRTQRPLPPAWLDRTQDASILALGGDGSLDELASTGIEEVTAYSGWARLTWQLTERNRLSVDAQASSLEASNVPLAPLTRGTAVDLESTAVTAGATVTTWGDVLSQELRVGFDYETENWSGRDQPLTHLVASGISFGSSFAAPAELRRVTFRASETVHAAAGRHNLKFGGGVTVRIDEPTYAPLTMGRAMFSDPAAATAGRGAFEQAVGGVVSARNQTLQAAAFLQDRWAPTPNLTLTFGLRYEYEKPSGDEITTNADWVDATGIDNAVLDVEYHKFSPRGSFEWRGPRSQWLVRGSGGVYYDLIAPAALTEAAIQDGSVDMRRGVGTLPAWPAVPDSVDAPVQGAVLTLLGPQLEAPRSLRGSLGVTRVLGTAALHLSVAYRHTDYLLRRADLNRFPGVQGTDQYDRPLYGALQQEGLVVAAAPGSNRRFAAFDLVSALNPDGYSDYVGFTAAVERQLGHSTRLWASYTYSTTEDNTLGLDGVPSDHLSPFPDSLDGADWADGVSDFDVPHRLAIGLVTPLFTPRVHLGAFYRFETGRPFTPMVAGGIDANGDGSAFNDPAFVDADLPGMDALLSSWTCLRSQSGGFADRNSCRGPNQHHLDLQLGFQILEQGNRAVEVVVEAVNLIEPDRAIVDRTLVTTDGTAPLTTNQATGTTTVPLLVNDNFGAPLARLGSGRFVRLGVRFAF